MRRLRLLVVLLATLGGEAAPAQDTAAPAIRAVISGQISAFRAEDISTAFGFASPAIRAMFGTPERFAAMVREGYPMVWRPADVRFSRLDDRDGRKLQGVLVTDEAGALHALEYEMVPVDGGWRINGVWMRHVGDAGA